MIKTLARMVMLIIRSKIDEATMTKSSRVTRLESFRLSIAEEVLIKKSNRLIKLN